MSPLQLVCMLAVFAGMLPIAAAQKPVPAPATQPGDGAAGGSTAWPFDAAEATKRQDAAAKELGVPKTGELAVGQGGMKLALIPAGKFVMGSAKDEKEFRANQAPQHEVTITKAFYMGVYPVTQQQYQQVTGKNPSQFKGPNNPVEMMSWDDAVAFCKAASAKTGKVVRLPTEAEWEYACRAGAATSWYFGDDASKIGDYAWYGANSEKKTHPVGQKKPNAWGLCDLCGNVWEWCSDWVGEDYYSRSPKEDPQGPATGTFRVLRGGSWPSDPAFCRSAIRLQNLPPHRVGKIGSFGFRVVVEVAKK